MDQTLTIFLIILIFLFWVKESFTLLQLLYHCMYDSLSQIYYKQEARILPQHTPVAKFSTMACNHPPPPPPIQREPLPAVPDPLQGQPLAAVPETPDIEERNLKRVDAYVNSLNFSFLKVSVFVLAFQILCICMHLANSCFHLVLATYTLFFSELTSC